MLALACRHQVCYLSGKTGFVTNSSGRFFAETIRHRLQSTPDWQPTSRRKPEIFHHFSPQIYLTQSSETVGPEIPARLVGGGGFACARTLRGPIDQSINQSHPNTGWQSCSCETSNLTVVAGANHRGKTHTHTHRHAIRHLTHLPISRNVWLVC